MTPGGRQAWKSQARFPHLQTSDDGEVYDFLPGLLANKEMAQRSNPALWKPVEQNSLYKAVYLKRNRAQRIPSWPGANPHQQRPYTFAQTKTPTSLFACGKAADHTLSYLASSGPNHEAVPCCFDDCGRDQMKVVDAENPLDLSEKSGQEPEVSAGHAYEAC
jgi:hypothetical protein